MKGILLVCILFLIGQNLSAQCLTPPVIPAHNNKMTATRNNDNISNGQQKRFTGTATFSNLSLNGGSLIVYGDLILIAEAF